MDACIRLDIYWHNKEFDKWFEGYLEIAKTTGYPLAECQVGYCYLEGIGVEKNMEKAVEWTREAAIHGDRDAQYNLGCMIEEKLFETAEDAADWFKIAAVQAHDPEIRSKAVFEFTTGGTA